MHVKIHAQNKIMHWNIVRNNLKHAETHNTCKQRHMHCNKKVVCQSYVLQTSLNDKCDSVGSRVNDMKCLCLIHSIRLETINSHNLVIHLTAAITSLLYLLTNLQS